VTKVSLDQLSAQAVEIVVSILNNYFLAWFDGRGGYHSFNHHFCGEGEGSSNAEVRKTKMMLLSRLSLLTASLAEYRLESVNPLPLDAMTEEERFIIVTLKHESESDVTIRLTFEQTEEMFRGHPLCGGWMLSQENAIVCTEHPEERFRQKTILGAMGEGFN
jgi:hypothetical protein